MSFCGCLFQSGIVSVTVIVLSIHPYVSPEILFARELVEAEKDNSLLISL